MVSRLIPARSTAPVRHVYGAQGVHVQARRERQTVGPPVTSDKQDKSEKKKGKMMPKRSHFFSRHNDLFFVY